MILRHCSDELLVEHLDGELPARVDGAVKNHLKLCWKCRARLTELEEQAEAFARAVKDQVFPGPDRIAEAKHRFFERAAEFEADRVAAPQFTLLSGSWGQTGLKLVCFLLYLVVLGIWVSIDLSRSKATEAVAKTEKIEQGLYRGPLAVHQTYRVEIVQTRPHKRTHTSTLGLWYEPDSGRFASRWVDAGGVLKHAAWRPESKREYSYDPDLTPGVVSRHPSLTKVISFADLSQYGLDLEQLETGFVKWLKSRRWRPILLASDFALFSAEDGVSLRAERVRSHGAGPAIQVTAQRQANGLEVQLTLEVDANTYRPRLLRARFETPERSAEVRLVADGAEFVPRVVPAVFEPNLPLSPFEQRADLLKRAPADELSTDRPSSHIAALADPEQVEAEVRYALHRAGACLGEPIEIARDRTGLIVVHGLATAARKAELLAALDPLQVARLVKVEIRTTDEVADAALTQVNPSSENTASTPLEENTQYISSAKPPLQDQIERYFAGHRALGTGQDVRQETMRFSNEVVSLSDEALAEAWGLRRLAERYPSGKAQELHPPSNWLLEGMVRDHITAVRTRTNRLQALLEPVLSSILGGRAGRLPGQPAPEGAEWTAVCLAQFEKVQEMSQLIDGLFAGAGLPEQQAEEEAAHLLAVFPQLEADSERLEADVVRAFSGNPALVSATR